MSRRIIILGNVDEDLTNNARGQNLTWVAQEFNCERVRIIGPPGDHIIRQAADIILGIRWPFYVILRGPLLGTPEEKEPKAMGYVGRVDELGYVLMKETVPR